MKVACAQINPVIGDFAGNAAKIIALSEEARTAGCGLAVFPEMCLCGYPPMDLLEYELFVEENLKALRRVQAEVPVEIPVRRNRGGHSAARPT